MLCYALVEDWLAPLGTTVYRLGCPPMQSWNLSVSANLVSNGDLEDVWQPGAAGCAVWNAGCQHSWTLLSPSTYGGGWADSKARALVSTTLSHGGRHSLRVRTPDGAALIKDVPLDGEKLVQLAERIGQAGSAVAPWCAAPRAGPLAARA
jgi:hypothetical protein